MNNYTIKTIRKIESALIGWNTIKNDYLLIKLNRHEITLQHIKCKHINTISIKSFNHRIKYNKGFCSNPQCKNEKTINTWLQKYNVTNPSKCEFIKNQKKQKSLKQYGTETPFQAEEIKAKIKQTNKINYGVEYISQSPIVKQKIKSTNKSKYGVECVFNRVDVRKKTMENYANNIDKINEKKKQTCLNKFGTEWALQNKDVRQKSKETCIEKYSVEHISRVESIQEKKKQTCLGRYGVEYVSQIASVKAIKKQNEKQREIKRYNTMKDNNTFHTSKPEDEYYEKLKESFPNVMRHYKDSRYPFACDFYVQELDVFIELNLHWTHGFRPFDENDSECKMQLVNWKEKAAISKFYKAAIEVWTERDVQKRIIAEKNDLSYIEIFNLGENLWQF